MTEGRLGQVRLLDDRQLELLVQPKLLSRDLLDLVASHFNLKEKEYFGISFTDETGQSNWLQLDRRVLEHNFSKKTGPLELKFLVRFYIENITFLKDTTTVELFFLNAKSCVFNGLFEVESDHVFKLAAYALQEANGDYVSDERTQEDLKKLPTLPTKVLTEHPSLAYCEDRVIEHYKKLKGLTRGQAIVKYLALVQSFPNYGVHYYEVKDKQGLPWWLGVSYKGIGQYDQQDKLKPRKLFQWKQLENLYFREKKFAVEVNDPHRRVVSKRTFGQSGLVIHSWYASHTLIKTIWVMAISQHQFYLDRKQSKAKLTTGRSLGDIAMDLTEIGAPRVSKLVSMETKDQLIMASNGSLVSTGSGDSNEEKKQEKIADLKKKEKDLQDTLSQKLDELKTICLREAELTGRLPKEYPLQSGEKAPTIRKRVGTTFKLDDLFPYDKDPHLRNLESRFALQQKIVEAAKKLASEGDLCKTVKKKRRRNCLDSMRKLQEIEDEINAYRIKTGKTPTQRASIIIDEANPSDLSSLSDSLTLEDDDSLIGQRQRSRSVQYTDQPSESLGVQYYTDRRASTNDQLQDVNLTRLGYGEDEFHHAHRDVVSGHSSPYRPVAWPGDTRGMHTPVCHSAFSSTQLSYEDGPRHFRQRSGSLESQQAFLTEGEAHEAPYMLAVPRRSTSTEILDDGSSYTSQSSVEYGSAAPGYHHGGGANHMPRARRLHQRRGGANIYANTGSMPNLAQHDAYRPPSRATSTTTAYYVTGYPCHNDPEPYSNGAYAYENESEGHYSVNSSASYYYPPQQQQHHQAPTAYYGHEGYRSGYGHDELDSLSQHNVYATLRPPRNNRPPSRNEHPPKNLQKALVAEHLRGWYNRNTTSHKPPPAGAYDYDRGSQHSLGYQTMSSTYGHVPRNASYSSVSSASSAGHWRSNHVSTALDNYEQPAHLAPPQSYGSGYSAAHYVQPAHSRYSSCRPHVPCSRPDHQHHHQQQHRLPQHLPPASSSSSSPACSSSRLSSRPPSSSSFSSSIRYRVEPSGSPARQLSGSRPERYPKSPLC
ncbi:FERM domain-containing protein 4B isoform X1 [Alosa alosa]|uniref:FERM domain-containing protein 4B isoform X1 n=1 Tax=Alosa alosa TaxID=278164 RepID=UPI002015461B|nr:FERM domain-containing protein 4B isoform X1 [Alosa alosa]XP_048110775.1 FERM domain-containing protein 4B isoform X1 [Alosa alosa]